jgi:coproporphyrinogen III oxidase
MNKLYIAERLKEVQDSICADLEKLDGDGKFKQDLWDREEGGGGRTRVIQGKVIEKGGVNFSAVHGPLSNKIAQALKIESGDFFASGVSIVLHPANPHVPIIHMNIRYFEMSNGTWWFGGGIDLTPHYVDPVLAGEFHRALKKVCDKHHPEYYTRFKKWADDYFYIRHRKETRGVGGIFFDRLNEETEGLTKEQLLAFILDIGYLFAPLYKTMVEPKRNLQFTEQQKQWQHIRRGRYAEFNLVYDKGTKFGLDTDGRIESILMSLPPMAEWLYDHHPSVGSTEAESLKWHQKGIDWIHH